MEQVCYNCTALAGTNKAGILTPDANGYFDVILGAFDFPNSAGSVYPSAPALKLMEASGSLMRRINTGQCRGEYGHPKKEAGMTNAQFINRILTIEETRIACVFKDVRIDKDSIKDDRGRPVIAVRGKVKPCGPYGEYLLAQLQNPDENVAFSVRSLTRDQRVAGILQKVMRTLVTWDYVNEPGIAIATKYNSPSLESMSVGLESAATGVESPIWTGTAGSDIYLGEQDFIMAEDELKQTGISLESGLDHKMVRSELGWSKVQNLSTKSFLDW